jgi:hypothetical protein
MLTPVNHGTTTMGIVDSVSHSSTHSFSKQPRMWITLLAGLGVEGDAHLGTKVKHRSRVARDPSAPNLRQVHLLHRELLQELQVRGFVIGPGQIGENILTRGLDLLGLPEGALLRIGTAEIRVTGLRNPCIQLDRFKPGLMAATLDRAADGSLIRKAGIMGVVLAGGDVRPGDPIQVTLPATFHIGILCARSNPDRRPIRKSDVEGGPPWTSPPTARRQPQAQPVMPRRYGGFWPSRPSRRHAARILACPRWTGPDACSRTPLLIANHRSERTIVGRKRRHRGRHHQSRSRCLP